MIDRFANPSESRASPLVSRGRVRWSLASERGRAVLAAGTALAGLAAASFGFVLAGIVLGATGIAGLTWLGNEASRRAARATARALGAERLSDAAAQAVAMRDGAGRWSMSARMAALTGADPAAALSAADGSFAAAWAGLKAEGRAFATGLTLAGHPLRVTGRHQGGDTVLVAEEDGERRQAMDALRAERDAARAEAEGWRAMFRALPAMAWLRDAEGKLIACNDAFARAVDTDPDTAVREQRDLRAGTVSRERVSVAIGGERRLLDLTEVPVTDAPGGASTLGLAVDRTDAEEARGELRRHVDAHAEVLERLNTAIAIFGSDTRLTFFNQAYARLWGLDEGWLHSEPTHAELMEELRAHRRLPETADFKSFKNDRLALYTRLIEPMEELMHLPDGTTLRVLATPHPLGGLILVQEDVTNTLALESSYNTLMAVQEETLDSLTEGVAVFGGDGRLKYANPAFARLWELRHEDLQGEPHIAQVVARFHPFFTQPDGDGDGGWSVLREEMISATLDRAVRSARLERADGSVVEFTTLPLSDGAVLNGYLDVTDSSRLQEALLASNAALESAEELKGEFISNISHHLRTPLNGIIGFAEVLTNQYFGPLNERQLEYVRGIVNAGGRLLEVIDDIADLTNVGAGVGGLDWMPVPVAGVVETVAALTREWARSEGVRLEVLVDPAGVGTVDGDPRRLKQALFTLVVSALRTAPRDGRVVLAVERTADAVVLTVGDTAAPGNSGTFRYRSAGAESLGLTLVRSVIEQHGGDMQVDGMPGRVTRVRCALPLPS
jgi:signal transduction histidine kinase